MKEQPPLSLKAYRPQLIVIGLLALTSIVVALTVNPNISGEAGVKVAFPDRVGQWTGEELRFCTAPSCRKTWSLKELANLEICPACEGKLDTMTIGERNLLPGDTVLLKKRFSHPNGKTIYAAIVLSGAERASIHRPERCLVGQGNEIVNQYTISIDFDNRKPLDVRVLNLNHRRTAADGTLLSEYYSYYAYWFVGKNRETSSHYRRMFFMASDRVLHNIAHRWAYISVSGMREKDSEEYREEISAFIRELYPYMAINS